MPPSAQRVQDVLRYMRSIFWMPAMSHAIYARLNDGRAQNDGLKTVVCALFQGATRKGPAALKI